MIVALLSGGSGKRLWPLSNTLRSKQYIKILKPLDEEGIPGPAFQEASRSADPQQRPGISMLQRVWSQLGNAGYDQRLVTAGNSQIEIIHSQLGEDAMIAVEPDRRDTFAAIVLSCCYAHDMLRADEDEPILFMPVDPYTDEGYFERFALLEKTLKETDAEVVLMGYVPTAPDSKFGYVVPGTERLASGALRVDHFEEKPEHDKAVALINRGALWNCGVFCLRIGSMLREAEKYVGTSRYRDVYAGYDALPRISFDYQVLERAKKLYVVPFQGLWKDLGSWDSLTGQMDMPMLGPGILDHCENTQVINELEVPVTVMGIDNAVVVASYDGILVSSKEESARIKDVAAALSQEPMYEERRWGTLKTLERSENEAGFTLLRKITFFDGMSSSYHYHNERIEVMTVLSGLAEMIIDGTHMTLSQGSTVTIPTGKKHAVKAIRDFSYLETHIGTSIGNDDINRITFDWNEILHHG